MNRSDPEEPDFNPFEDEDREVDESDLKEGDRIFLFTDGFPPGTPAVVRRVYKNRCLSVRIPILGLSDGILAQNLVQDGHIPHIVAPGEWELSQEDK